MATARTGLADPPEVAEFLKMPERTLGQWRYLGTGPRFVKIGRHVRYRWSDVEAWLADQGRTSTRSV